MPPKITKTHGIGDVDSAYNALRPRMLGMLGNIQPNPPIPPRRIIWRGEWAALTDYEKDDIVYLGSVGNSYDPVQPSIITYIAKVDHTSIAGDPPVPGGTDNWHEFTKGSLLIDGQRPMTGDLDMDTHEIDNILNANFSGPLGDARINSVRVAHFIGDDDDSEARIDGLEAVIFNDEPTKSYIRQPSRIEFNPNVTPGIDTPYLEATTQHSDFEKALQQDTDITNIRNTLGWVQLRWKPNVAMQALRIAYSGVHEDNAPEGTPFDIALDNWDEADPKRLPSFGLTMHLSSDEAFQWVMQRGILRDYDETLIDGSFTNGDVLWAKGASGLITAARPTYQMAPHIVIGRVIKHADGLVDIEVDVRVLPLVHALPGHSWRRQFMLMGA